jgi:hypothetical protein
MNGMAMPGLGERAQQSSIWRQALARIVLELKGHKLE